MKTLIRALVFVVIGILLFFLVTPIFIPKTINEERGFYRAIIQGFYEEPENSLDAVFIGDSSIYKGISPIKIWQEYGIASYNFASPTQRMWDSYYSVKEIIKHQKPKVIVLNIDEVFKEKPAKEAYKRHLYDNMPGSINKLNAIMDPVQKNNIPKQISFIFPLLRFHSRWSELSRDDFIYAYGKYHYPLKGYSMVTKKKPYKKRTNHMKKTDENSKINIKAEEYLMKIKDICAKNDIQLLLVEMPNPTIWNKAKHKEIEVWSNKNKVPFIDMNEHLKEIGINWKTDTGDAGAHLNIYGAEKVSNYIGDYLKKNYTIEDHRNDESYNQWHEDSKQYEIEKVKQQ